MHNVCWDKKRKHWLFILWSHIKGGPKYLCRIDEEGSIISKEEIGEMSQYSFSGDGQMLITSNGEIIDTFDLKVIWKFCEKELKD